MRLFFSRVNFVYWLLFGVSSTPLLPQWSVKDPGHSAKSADGRLHLNTHTPLTQRSRSGLTMPLSRQSVGTYPETSSHATRQRTLGHSRHSSLSHSGLILAKEWNYCAPANLHFKKKCRRRLNCRTCSRNSRKSHQHHHSLSKCNNDNHHHHFDSGHVHNACTEEEATTKKKRKRRSVCCRCC